MDNKVFNALEVFTYCNSLYANKATQVNVSAEFFFSGIQAILKVSFRFLLEHFEYHVSLPISPPTSYFSSSSFYSLATWCRWGVYIIVWYDCRVVWTGSQPC